MHVFKGDHKKTLVCRKRLTYFYDEFKLLKHQLICRTNEPCIVKVPKEDWLTYKPENYKCSVPFRTCNFECFNARLDLSKGSQIQNIYHPNPVAPGSYILSELPRVLKSG